MAARNTENGNGTFNKWVLGMFGVIVCGIMGWLCITTIAQGCEQSAIKKHQTNQDEARRELHQDIKELRKCQEKLGESMAELRKGQEELLRRLPRNP